MIGSKVCFKCLVQKPLDQFYKHPQMKDGHLNKCKECAKKDVAEHRELNIDRIRKYDLERAKRPERVKMALEQTRKWRAEDSRRSQCHSAVAQAIRKGELQPKACEHPGCGRPDAMAHHESYDQPLVVVWYCQVHHKKRHAQMKRSGINP